MPFPLTHIELQALAEHDFLQYATVPRAMDKWRPYFQRESLLESDATGRSFYIDAECLAEGGARYMLEDLEPFLSGQGSAF